MSLDNLPPLDIQTFLQTAFLLSLVGALLSIWSGLRAIRASRQLRYYRLRRGRLVFGWRVLLFGIILAFLSAAIRLVGEPVAYQVFPVTATAP